MASPHKSPAPWHRHSLMNVMRFAAANREEQARATPRIMSSIRALRDTLVDSWEHAMDFERRHQQAEGPLLSDEEREAVGRIYEEVSELDYETIDDEQYLDQLRPRARAVVDRLGWAGAIDPRILPGRVSD